VPVDERPHHRPPLREVARRTGIHRRAREIGAEGKNGVHIPESGAVNPEFPSWRLLTISSAGPPEGRIMDIDLYERDFFAWTEEQAALLRAGNVSALDLEHLAEEIESLGSSQRSELRRRLARLLRHLLKYQCQPEHRSRSWATAIRVQRDELAGVLNDSPSLRPTVPAVIPNAYRLGRDWALDETGLFALPEECPWTAEQVLSQDFLPD